MTEMVVLSLDGDSAGHLAVALHALATRNRKQGRVFPAALVALQAAAESVVQTGEPMRLTITNVDSSEAPGRTEQHGAAKSETVANHRHDDPHGTRPYLTRTDVARLAGVHVSTVDRWLTNDQLQSHKVGGIRRIRRSDLDQFLGCRAA